MNLGRQCPRIRELGSLYPSKRLQKALCDYYAAIIRLCKHSTQHLQKSGVHTSFPSLSASSSLPIDMFLVHSRLPKEILVSFKAEFGPYEGEISRLSQEVRDEASLASKQAQKQENELQATHRQNWMKFTKDYYTTKAEENDRRLEVNRRKLEKNRLEALDALSTYNYQKTYKQLRKECVPGTSIWICGNPVFHKWLSGAFQTLWLIGRCKCMIAPSGIVSLT